MQTKTSRNSGFTIWEIVFVLAIMVVVAWIVFPNYFRIKVRTTFPHNACIAALKEIDGAKQQWAVEHKQLATAVPAFSDLVGTNLYMRAIPICPLGGTYTFNAVSANPTCSKSATPDGSHKL